MERRQHNRESFLKAYEETKRYRQELITQLIGVIQEEDMRMGKHVDTDYSYLARIQAHCRVLEQILGLADSG